MTPQSSTRGTGAQDYDACAPDCLPGGWWVLPAAILGLVVIVWGLS